MKTVVPSRSENPRAGRGDLDGLRRVFLVGVGLAFASVTGMGAASLDIGEAAVEPGREVHVAVLLQTDRAVVAGEFEVVHESPYLDLASAEQSGGSPTHRVRSSVPATGRQRVVLYSIANAPLGEGAIARLALRVLPNAPDVTVSLTLTNALLVAADGSTIQPLTLSSGRLHISATKFVSVSRDPSGTVDLELSTRPDERYVLQVSPSLIAPVWSNLSTNVATNGVIRVQDPSSQGQAERFYRAVLAP